MGFFRGLTSKLSSHFGIVKREKIVVHPNDIPLHQSHIGDRETEIGSGLHHLEGNEAGQREFIDGIIGGIKDARQQNTKEAINRARIDARIVYRESMDRGLFEKTEIFSKLLPKEKSRKIGEFILSLESERKPSLFRAREGLEGEVLALSGAVDVILNYGLDKVAEDTVGLYIRQRKQNLLGERGKEDRPSEELFAEVLTFGGILHRINAQYLGWNHLASAVEFAGAIEGHADRISGGLGKREKNFFVGALYLFSSQIIRNIIPRCQDKASISRLNKRAADLEIWAKRYSGNIGKLKGLSVHPE